MRRQNQPKRKGTYEIKSLHYRYVFQTPLCPFIYPAIAINVALIGIEA